MNSGVMDNLLLRLYTFIEFVFKKILSCDKVNLPIYYRFAYAC